MYKIPLTFAVTMTVLWGILPPMSAFADHSHNHAATSPTTSHQATSEPESNLKPQKGSAVVLGMVCAFCAQGLKKKITKLDFIDTSATNEVKIDIETGDVQFAIKGVLDVKKFNNAVESAGYALQSLHWRDLSGTHTYAPE